MNIKLTLITILLTCLPLKTLGNQNHLENIASNYNDNTVSQIGAKSMGEFIKRTRDSVLLSPLKIENFESSKTSSFEVKWLINRKRISRILEPIIPLYRGEKPALTESSVKQITNDRNNLYFYLKPLGQLNGLTFDLSKDAKIIQYYRNILKDFSVFIRVNANNETRYIPIASPAPLSGCGNILENNTAKLWCLQTSPPTDKEYSIGYLNNLSNKIIINSKINSPDDITLEWLITYKGEKV